MDAKSFVESKPDTQGPVPPKYNRGDRVRLSEHDSGTEIIPEMDAIVLSVDWFDWAEEPDDYMYVVEVTPTDSHDDGLRELTQDQIKGPAA